jgi:hypothetical protein
MPPETEPDLGGQTMRNLLALLGAALVTFAVVGWFRDWYKIQTGPDAAGHREVNIDINGRKIKQDLNKGREKLHEVLDHKGQETAPAAAHAAPNAGTPAFAPPPGFGPTVPTSQGEEFVLPSGNAVAPTPAPRVYHD